eukprot:TRINITY_DN4898_c0_g1_i1.p1 TRINITY_DN4898_c0_g1~~TRINITY_DN4898_c0_g1_i1.p1  ORF type:complete len:122 (+),score=12.03 TRINITY_DN4898_c0_g1_i1:941-1306(+)
MVECLHSIRPFGSDIQPASRIPPVTHFWVQNSPIYGVHLLGSEISDHCPVFVPPSKWNHTKSPFCYFNAWARIPNFSKVVREAWIIQIKGSPIFGVIKKLSNVKKALINWQRSQPSASAKD